MAPITAKAIGERVSAYYARGRDGLRAVRAGSSMDEGIILDGGRNVISPREGTFSVMSVEDVVALKSSIIILAEGAEQGSPLRKLYRLKPAFSSIPERPPSLNRLIGALWLVSRLYPDEISFPVDDARRMNVALFHRVPTDPTINEMFR